MFLRGALATAASAYGRDVYTVDCRHMSTKSILCLPKPGRLAVYQSTKFGRRAPRVYQSTKFPWILARTGSEHLVDWPPAVGRHMSTVYQVYSEVDLGIARLLGTQGGRPDYW